jgi:hypothetical protein
VSLIREQSPTSPLAPTSPSTPSNINLTLAPPTSAHRSSSTGTSSAVTPTPLRPSSPTLSNSSTSTNSTHTAVPTNPHPRASKSNLGNGHGNGHAHDLAPLTTPTPSSAALRTPTNDSPSSCRAKQQRRGARSPARRNDGETRSPSMERRPTSWYVLTRTSTTIPGSGRSSLVVSIQTALRPYIRFAPLFLLCVILPALAMLLRFLRNRRRWPKLISPSSSAVAAAATSIVAGVGSESGAAARTRAVEDVRRRLSGVQGRRGLLGTLWDEAVRAVSDTVTMGGRGLV